MHLYGIKLTPTAGMTDMFSNRVSVDTGARPVSSF
jgi:hypothetical protein